jgi:hypothetical protein
MAKIFPNNQKIIAKCCNIVTRPKKRMFNIQNSFCFLFKTQCFIVALHWAHDDASLTLSLTLVLVSSVKRDKQWDRKPFVSRPGVNIQAILHSSTVFQIRKNYIQLRPLNVITLNRSDSRLEQSDHIIRMIALILIRFSGFYCTKQVKSLV